MGGRRGQSPYRGVVGGQSPYRGGRRGNQGSPTLQ